MIGLVETKLPYMKGTKLDKWLRSDDNMSWIELPYTNKKWRFGLSVTLQSLLVLFLFVVVFI
jgi:hypothetical protein